MKFFSLFSCFVNTFVITFVKQNKQKHKDMNTQTINQQVLELAMNPSFIKTCAKIAKTKGITASEWNQDKVHILYMWATQVICAK